MITRNELSPTESKYPLPGRSMIIPVTADMASDWLSHRNHPKNRKISASVSARYQHAMESRLWREGTPEGYIFDTDGYLINGQHRLRAQANSGITLNMYVFPNQSRDIFAVLDGGFKRTAGQMLGVSYASIVSASLRHLAALSDGDSYGMPRYSRITSPEVLALFPFWPETSRYVRQVHTIWQGTRVPTGTLNTVLALASRTDSADRIPDFLEGLHTGADMPADDSRLRLSRRFNVAPPATPRGLAQRDMNYAMVVKAWNAFIKGHGMQNLRFQYGERLPQVEGFDWDIQGRPEWGLENHPVAEWGLENRRAAE